MNHARLANGDFVAFAGLFPEFFARLNAADSEGAPAVEGDADNLYPGCVFGGLLVGVGHDDGEGQHCPGLCVALRLVLSLSKGETALVAPHRLGHLILIVVQEQGEDIGHG